MKPDIILTPLRNCSTGPLKAEDTVMSFATRIGCTLCSCPESTSSSHAEFDLADHFTYHRIAQGPSEQSAISPPSIQSP